MKMPVIPVNKVVDEKRIIRMGGDDENLGSLNFVVF
jgi:hypothetical protein